MKKSGLPTLPVSVVATRRGCERITDPRDFGRFNAVYASYFGDNPPARSTVRAQLVLDGKLEVEAIAYKPR